MTDSKRCQYCGQPAECVSGKEVYPHIPKLHNKWFWECKPCGARVGCHGTSKNPLGDLATHELRVLRMRAHDKFDQLWLRGDMSRKDAYVWLAKSLGIPFHACHIGQFSGEDCVRVIEACREFQKEKAT